MGRQKKSTQLTGLVYLRAYTLLMLMLTAASCRPSGAPCKTTPDCLDQEVCFDGRCVPVCNVTADCSAGQACANGACRTTGANCSYSVDCLPTETCVDRHCTIYCDSARDCTDGQGCSGGRCEITGDSSAVDSWASDSVVSDRSVWDSRRQDGSPPDTVARDQLVASDLSAGLDQSTGVDHTAGADAHPGDAATRHDVSSVPDQSITLDVATFPDVATQTDSVAAMDLTQPVDSASAPDTTVLTPDSASPLDSRASPDQAVSDPCADVLCPANSTCVKVGGNAECHCDIEDCGGYCRSASECCSNPQCGSGAYSCTNAHICACAVEICGDGYCRSRSECCSGNDCGSGSFGCNGNHGCTCGSAICNDGYCRSAAECCTGSDCGSGNWSCNNHRCSCGGGNITCNGDCRAPNACGGCSTLAGIPGSACGTCGTWACDGNGADWVNCEGDHVLNRYYKDTDGDSYGTSTYKDLCAPSGFFTAAVDGDCLPNDINSHPGASETCDGVDNDCNASTADGTNDCNSDGSAYCCDSPPACQTCCSASQCGSGIWTCDAFACVCNYTTCQGGCYECCADPDCPQPNDRCIGRICIQYCGTFPC